MTADLRKHGIVVLFPCLNCDNLVLKKCLSLCLEVHCYNDWWLQNCLLQHLECFMFSFKSLWAKGQKKVFYDLMHSCLRSVTRWPQTLTQMNLHNAGQDSLQRQCQVSESIQAMGSTTPLSVAPNATKTSGLCHFCTNICDCIRIKWCSQCWTQGLITAQLWPPLCFSSCAWGVDPNKFWWSRVATVRVACKDPKASQFVSRTNAPSGTFLMMIKHCLIKNKLFLSLKKLLPFCLCSWSFRWRWFYSTILI